MKIEIEFRGKRLDNDKWVCGDLVHDGQCGCYIYPLDSLGLFVENKVDPDTVGQFTGLRDKNGKDIYEGDIVKCEDFVYQVIYEGKRMASFALHRKEDVFLHYFGEAIEAEDCEVIGNIHDNKELLNKK